MAGARRQGRGLCAGSGETGGMGGAVEEERVCHWVVSALSVWNPRCTHPSYGFLGSHKGSPKRNVWPERPSQQPDRQVEVKFLTCSCLPRVGGLRWEVRG